MGNENLYEIVKNKICDEIFAGHYSDGDRIPPERELEETLGVSRVTVRKSLELLEEDRLIVREVGRGTRVTLRNGGNKSDLDMIVLIAPAKNPFFSKFIAHFQNYAQEKGSLILYVEKPRTEELESCLYRLYKRGLRNVVVWLEDLPVDIEKLKRLRAIGMNMVFFDSDKGFPYADCVTLDNELAVKTLYSELKARGYENIGYIGWNLKEAYSIRAREKTYQECSGEKAPFLLLPWKEEVKSEALVTEALNKCGKGKLDSVICSDRQCGSLTVRAAAKSTASIKIATVDELSKNEREGVLMYRQDLAATVEQIFACLENQCTKEEKWKAEIFKIEGEIVN